MRCGTVAGSAISPQVKPCRLSSCTLLGWEASKLDRWLDDLGAPWCIDYGSEFTSLEVGVYICGA